MSRPATGARALAATLVAMLGWSASVPAWAQTGDACAWAVGLAGSHPRPSDSFTLLTPRGAWSLSPVLSTQCSRSGAAPWAPFAGVDLVPTLRHSYRRLGERGSLLVLARLGVDARLARSTRVGLQVTTNGAAWGSGLRWRYLPPPSQGLGVRGFEFRFDVLAGETLDLQATLLLHLHHRWVGERSERDHVEDSERWARRRRWRVASGFEMGAVTGLRLQLTPGVDGQVPELGLRLGALTNLAANLAVQPIALARADFNTLRGFDVQPQVALSAGVMRRDGKADPVAGLAVEVENAAAPFAVHWGTLYGLHEGESWMSVDVGVSSLW